MTDRSRGSSLTGLLLVLLHLDGLGGKGGFRGFVRDDLVENDGRGAAHAVAGAQDQDDTVAEGLTIMASNGIRVGAPGRERERENVTVVLFRAFTIHICYSR